MKDDVPVTETDTVGANTPNSLLEPSSEQIADSGPNDSAETSQEAPPVATHEQWTGVFEQKGYIKEAPNFSDQVADTTRTNTFRYIPFTTSYDPADSVELTEQEGLVGLQQFLEKYADAAEANDDFDAAVLAQKARSMLDNLTFIGEKEYEEAVKGLGDYWKAYLDEDPERQICVLTRIGRIVGNGYRKSDAYLLERILETFTDEELEKYGSRIVTELEDIASEKDKLKVILLDDWTISGSQISGAYESVYGSAGHAYDDCMEVNLIAASPQRIANGVKGKIYRNQGPPPPTMPVRAYYLAHDAQARSTFNAHITGTHSSVDYDFQNDIYTMLDYLKKFAQKEEKSVVSVKLPPLTQIVRAYRYTTPSIAVQRSKITRVQPETDEQ